MIDDFNNGGKPPGVWARGEEDDTTDFYQSPLGNLDIDVGHWNAFDLDKTSCYSRRSLFDGDVSHRPTRWVLLSSSLVPRLDIQAVWARLVRRVSEDAAQLM